MKPPCDRTCPDRKVGCHGKCAKYTAYRAEMDQILEMKRRHTEAENTVSEGVERTSKRKRQY